MSGSNGGTVEFSAVLLISKMGSYVPLLDYVKEGFPLKLFSCAIMAESFCITEGHKNFLIIKIWR